MTRIELLPGITLCCETTGQFKSDVLTAYLFRKLDAAEAPVNALIPQVLRRGNKKRPDMKTMSDALADFYGALLIGGVRKRGEWQCFGLASSFIAGNLDGIAALMLDSLLEPVITGYVEAERKNLINQISAQKNNKASYALSRLDALACAGEPYAIGRLGGEPEAASITEETLSAHYHGVLKNARIELFYCGREDPERVAGLVLPRLTTIERSFAPQTAAANTRTMAAPRYFTEYEDISQAKLAIMWRADDFHSTRSFLSAYVAAAIYGGDSGKLFENVRERLSLCYYADAHLDRYKAVIKARSGVEAANIEKTRTEMLAQWDAVAGGDFTGAELSHAKASIINGLKSISDSPAALESFRQGQTVAGLTESPNDLAAIVASIEKKDAVNAAQGFSLDSIYCMRAE